MKKLFIIIPLLILALFFGFKKTINSDNSNKIIFWTIQLKPAYEKQMNRIIQEFESKHQGYKIEWIDIPINEAQKRTMASILSSTPPDLVNLNPDFSILLAQKDTLEYFNEKDLEQFQTNLVEKLKYQGKVYALPYYATIAVTIYNKDLYNRCLNKKEFITTYDELFNLSNTQNCKNVSVFASSLNENDTLTKILNKYDVKDLKTPEEIKKTNYIFSNFNKMYKNEYLPKDALSLSHREVLEKYMAGQSAIIIAGANFINNIKKNAPDTYAKTNISYQLTGTNGEYDVSLMNLIIPKRAKNKELAKEFALLLTNKDNQMEFAKLSNVIPANKYTLEDNYFKICDPQNIYERARCISVEQLQKVNTTPKNKNSKIFDEAVNKTFEEILLNNASDDKFINQKVQELTKTINSLKD